VIPARPFIWLRNKRAASHSIRAATYSPSAWCCTRCPPQETVLRTNIITTLDAVLHQKPAPPLSLNPGLPPELQNIIGRAMEKDKTKRYQTAADMRSDLQHLKKETESGLTRTGAKLAQPLRVAGNTFRNSSKAQTYLLLGMTGL